MACVQLLCYQTRNEILWILALNRAPIVAALNKADEAMNAKIKEDTFRQFDEKFKDQPITPEAIALIINAEK